MELLRDGKKLKYKKDYLISYPESTPGYASGEPGEYEITITGTGNYTGTRTLNYTIAAQAEMMSKAKLSIPAQTISASGEVINVDSLIEGNVKIGSTVVPKEAYTVTYENNDQAGTAYVILNAVPNSGYAGSKRIKFSIKGAPINKAVVSGVPSIIEYTGSKITADDFEGGMTLSYNGDDLVEGKDYSVSYSKNMKVGTATMTITGEGMFEGSLKKSFKIDKVNLTGKINVDYEESVGYLKGGAVQSVNVSLKDGTMLREGRDFTVKYSNNKAVGTASMSITGKGNYKNSESYSFSVVKKELTNENGITVQAKDKVVALDKKSGMPKAGGFKQSFKVYDADGKALSSSDYDNSTVVYTLVDEPEVNNNSKEVGEVLDLKKDYLSAGSVIQITVSPKAGGSYDDPEVTGTAVGTYRILEANFDISKGKVVLKSGVTKAYTGKPIYLTPDDLTVTVGKGSSVITLKGAEENETGVYAEDVNYIILKDSYQKNIAKGTASVTIQGVGKYGGSKVVKFKIGTQTMAGIKDKFHDYINKK